MFVVPDNFSGIILNFLKDTDAPLEEIIVHLFQNDYVPTRSTVEGDFTEATFTGYAPSAAVPFAGPYYDPVLGPYLLGTLVTFTAGNPVTDTNIIYGYYVTSGIAGNPYAFGERFVTPIEVTTPSIVIPVVPTFGGVSQAA